MFFSVSNGARSAVSGDEESEDGPVTGVAHCHFTAHLPRGGIRAASAEFNDPLAVLSLERLLAIASPADRRWILTRQRMYAGIQQRDAVAGVRRSRAIDQIAWRFIADHPHATVINLACGLDTRFWRIQPPPARYLELDLPAVIALKKELLQDHLTYPLMPASVLDAAWIDTVTLQGSTDFLLIAEGLFMWLPPQEGKNLFRQIGERFARSWLVLDMVPERYTRGLWKTLVRLHSRLDWGLDVAWDFGIRRPQDIETYAHGLKVIAAAHGSAGPILTVSINPDR